MLLVDRFGTSLPSTLSQRTKLLLSPIRSPAPAGLLLDVNEPPQRISEILVHVWSAFFQIRTLSCLFRSSKCTKCIVICYSTRLIFLSPFNLGPSLRFSSYNHPNLFLFFLVPGLPFTDMLQRTLNAWSLTTLISALPHRAALHTLLA